MSELKDPYDDVIWFDALSFGIEGQGWSDLEPDYPTSRLPFRAKKKVNEKLWDYSLHSNGLSISFRTNAVNIFTRWKIAKQVYEWSASEGGLDCYGQDSYGNWQWVGKKTAWKQPEADGKFNLSPLDGLERVYRIYLPSGTPVTKLEVGISQAYSLSPIAPRPVAGGRGIVYYGTSIVYGAGVARPGMSHSNLLGRWLDQPIINLGFAGLAKMECEMAELVAELDPALFILDPLPNMDKTLIRERMAVFIKILRDMRPDTPILWVGERLLADSAFQPKRQVDFEENRIATTEVIESLRSEGFKHFYEIPGGKLFGSDNEGTGDGSHPNELGAMRMAQHLLPHVAKLLAHHTRT